MEYQSRHRKTVKWGSAILDAQRKDGQTPPRGFGNKLEMLMTTTEEVPKQSLQITSGICGFHDVQPSHCALLCFNAAYSKRKRASTMKMEVSPTCWQPSTRQNSVKTRRPQILLQTNKQTNKKRRNERMSKQASKRVSKQASERAKQFLALQAATSLSIKGQGYISM